MYRVTKLITANFSPVSPVVVGSQFQEEKEDVQRKLVILQDDLEKNEARADALHKEAQEKAGALDETERYIRLNEVSHTHNVLHVHQTKSTE